MPHKTQHTADPWASDIAHRTSADALFAPTSRAKTSHALESAASKLGVILALLAISSVAAVGMFVPKEDDPLAAPVIAAHGNSPQVDLGPSGERVVPPLASVPGDLSQQAYARAYELAKQRVNTVGGLTQPQRTETARDALAQVLGGDVSRLDLAAVESLANQAPDVVKQSALQGVKDGEAAGISEQSQLVINRMLSREGGPTPN